MHKVFHHESKLHVCCMVTPISQDFVWKVLFENECWNTMCWHGYVIQKWGYNSFFEIFYVFIFSYNGIPAIFFQVLIPWSSYHGDRFFWSEWILNFRIFSPSFLVSVYPEEMDKTWNTMNTHRHKLRYRRKGSEQRIKIKIHLWKHSREEYDDCVRRDNDQKVTNKT